MHVYLNLILCGSNEALGFAQSKFTPFGKEQKYVEKLEVCSSNEYIVVNLLSYPHLSSLTAFNYSLNDGKNVCAGLYYSSRLWGAREVSNVPSSELGTQTACCR